MVPINKYYFSVISIIIGLNSCESCGQNVSNETEQKIIKFIEKVQDEPINIFADFNIWKRNDSFIFDYKDEKEYRLLFVYDEKGQIFYREIFPKQDSVFYPLIEIENRLDKYPFKDADFTAILSLFKKLRIIRTNSFVEDDIIVFVVNDSSFIVYSANGRDIREMNRYSKYLKYNDYWYFYY